MKTRFSLRSKVRHLSPCFWSILVQNGRANFSHCFWTISNSFSSLMNVINKKRASFRRMFQLFKPSSNFGRVVKSFIFISFDRVFHRLQSLVCPWSRNHWLILSYRPPCVGKLVFEVSLALFWAWNTSIKPNEKLSDIPSDAVKHWL